MNAEKIEKAKSQLAAYGYTLSDSLQIEKGEKTFSVVVSAKGPRFYVKQLSGAPLWSGPDLGEFVRSFWYAKKVEPMVPNGSYREGDIVHENGDVWVLRDKKKNRYTVMIAGITHSTSDSSYPLSPDGLSVATARADYLARRKTQQTPMQTNGRGIYHETAAGKHDMVLHQDHRGAWRIDLVTSSGGNHTDVTGPNRGYGSAEEAFQAALDVQRTRGIRGKSHVFVADRDGNLSDYEPMETNGRATTVDSVAARELDLYIANTYELVGAPNSIGKSIDANLRRKLANGTYDSALAPKGWQALVDAGAKKYEREFGDSSPVFNAATRRQVAADFAAAWEEENQLTANQSGNDLNLTQAIKEAVGHNNRKHLEIWRAVSRRYPSATYEEFDRLMGRLEMDGVITLTGHRGPNTYKLA